MFYSVLNKDNNEIVDVLDLTDAQKISFCKANADKVLEPLETTENPFDIFDPFGYDEDDYE
jgi:hypothetical protein